MIKIRNNRTGQLFDPTRALLDKVESKRFLEVVHWREDMKAFANDSEHHGFLVGRTTAEVEVAAPVQNPGLTVPVVEPDEDAQGDTKPESADATDSKEGESKSESTDSDKPTLQALRENLLKKNHKALIKEALAAKLNVKESDSKESLVEAILGLYK